MTQKAHSGLRKRCRCVKVAVMLARPEGGQRRHNHRRTESIGATRRECRGMRLLVGVQGKTSEEGEQWNRRATTDSHNGTDEQPRTATELFLTTVTYVTVVVCSFHDVSISPVVVKFIKISKLPPCLLRRQGEDRVTICSVEKNFGVIPKANAERLLGVVVDYDSETKLFPWALIPKPNFPLVLYFHGGAYYISSPSDPLYHNSLNKLVAKGNVVAVSVNYRLAPEHPLPTTYQDAWVASHASQDGEGHENWLMDKVDFSRVFLAGDSAGAIIGHYMALRLHVLSSGQFKVRGLIMVHPYFWGKEPIGVEIIDPERNRTSNWNTYISRTSYVFLRILKSYFTL
ncbi:Alpha/Beta hydrolase fold [Sesbania bispinosa]|nr:Alpha/Beta hydrolase fold [Sesbania bispinosa]